MRITDMSFILYIDRKLSHASRLKFIMLCGCHFLLSH